MSIECFNVIPYFKVRKREDINTLLTKVLCKDNRYTFVINHDLAIFISISKDGKATISRKDGDLQDVLNVSLVLDDEEGKALLFHYRKLINMKLPK